jgi:hypothetical protein
VVPPANGRSVLIHRPFADNIEQPRHRLAGRRCLTRQRDQSFLDTIIRRLGPLGREQRERRSMRDQQSSQVFRPDRSVACQRHPVSASLH